jgi:hypothetical protein
MKIIEAKSELVENKGFPGLFNCKFSHKIKETSAVFDYTGPKFTRQMWHEILAFFKYSYARSQGESQVRLFVHPQQGWKAWAFPQEISFGLSTTELPNNPETKEQRAQFNDDWILYGTVHHHCAAGAFQSGTDTMNEKDQEGIHITVGNIDNPHHSIDVRFYYRGCKFKPDLTEFWDVGDESRDKARELGEYFGMTVSLDKQAEIQMCNTCPKETTFPDQWAANLIERPKVAPTWNATDYYRGVGAGSSNDEMDSGYKGFPSRAIKALRKYFKSYYHEDIRAEKGMTLEIREAIDLDVDTALSNLKNDVDAMFIFGLMDKHNCDLDGIIKRWNEIQILETKTPPKMDKEDDEDTKALQESSSSAELPPKPICAMSDVEFADYMHGGGKLPGQDGYGFINGD